MSNLFSAGDLSLTYDTSNPLQLSKSVPFSIDLLDLARSDTPYTPSSLSTYDSISVKAEEESLKPAANEDSLTCKDVEELVAVELARPKKMTLGDIVSKRPYTRRPKDINKIFEKTVEKRQRPINLQKDREEIQTKKEKLDNGVVKNVLVQNEDNNSFPEIVFKDGKAQIETPITPKEDGIKKELQVVETSQTKMTTSASFKQSVRAEKWTEIETAKFYRSLELFGTEFSMIAKVFKNRNRTQIKNKFLREEKTAPEKINAALKGSESITFVALLQKFQRFKETQALPDNINSHNFGFNIVKPLIFSDQIQPNQELISVYELESLQNSANIDNIDMDIMEDLADVFVSSKKSFLNV